MRHRDIGRGVFIRENYSAEGILRFHGHSIFNMDNSVSPLPADGDMLSISIVCAVCGVPVDSKDKLTAQRGFMVCKDCIDE